MRLTHPNQILLLLIGLFLFSACDGDTNTATDDPETEREEEMEAGMAAEIPTKRVFTVRANGVEEEVDAELYIAKKEAPIDFFTYVPEGFNANITNDPADNYSVNFAKDGHLLILTFLPNRTSEAQAIEAAKMRIEEAGEVVQGGSAMEYYLKENSEKVISTILKQHNGQYYYWTKQYPTEGAVSFEPYAMMIMENMTWQ